MICQFVDDVVLDDDVVLAFLTETSSTAISVEHTFP